MIVGVVGEVIVVDVIVVCVVVIIVVVVVRATSKFTTVASSDDLITLHKCSAVAEMGNRLATIDMDRKLGKGCAPSGGS